MNIKDNSQNILLPEKDFLNTFKLVHICTDDIFVLLNYHETMSVPSERVIIDSRILKKRSQLTF